MGGNIEDQLRRKNVHNSLDLYRRQRSQEDYRWLQMSIGASLSIRVEMRYRTNAVLHVSYRNLYEKAKIFQFCIQFHDTDCQMGRMPRSSLVAVSFLIQSSVMLEEQNVKFYQKVFIRSVNKIQHVRVLRNEKQAASQLHHRALKIWLTWVS